MDHAGAVGIRGQRDLLGAEGVHGVEALAAALGQDADQIDHDVASRAAASTDAA